MRESRNHRHAWERTEGVANVNRYACKCGADMVVEREEDGWLTTMFEPYDEAQEALEEG